MSERRLPQPTPLHSRADVAIGARLNIRSSTGAEHAKLVWFAVLARQSWSSLRNPAWATDTTLMSHVGLGRRRKVENAMTILRRAGMLTTPTGHRPGARRPWGRLLVPRLGSTVKVLIPDPEDMANLWALCRAHTRTPAYMVTATVGAYAIACDALGHRPFEWSELPCTQADLRRFVGARKNASWAKRLRDLEAVGVLTRTGRTLWISPPRAWWPSLRVVSDDDCRGPPVALAS